MSAGRRCAGNAVTFAVAAATVAGCSSLPEPLPEPVGTGPSAAVLASQVERILPAVQAVVTEADASADPAALAARVTGPQHAALVARYQVRAATGAVPPQSPGDWTLLDQIVPQRAGGPAFVLLVVQIPGRTTPSLLVLRSPGAREAYRLWAIMALLPGAQLPVVRPAREGAPVLAPDAEGLVATPAQVAGWYADVLTAGAASPHAAAFSDDSFRAQVGVRQDALAAAVAPVADTSSVHAPVADELLAVQTADGGALVVALVQAVTDIVVRPGAGSVRVDVDVAALAGAPEFAQRLTTTTAEVVAWYVPPLGGGTIETLAAQFDVVGAQGQ